MVQGLPVRGRCRLGLEAIKEQHIPPASALEAQQVLEETPRCGAPTPGRCATAPAITMCPSRPCRTAPRRTTNDVRIAARRLRRPSQSSTPNRGSSKRLLDGVTRPARRRACPGEPGVAHRRDGLGAEIARTAEGIGEARDRPAEDVFQRRLAAGDFAMRSCGSESRQPRVRDRVRRTQLNEPALSQAAAARPRSWSDALRAPGVRHRVLRERSDCVLPPHAQSPSNAARRSGSANGRSTL